MDSKSHVVEPVVDNASSSSSSMLSSTQSEEMAQEFLVDGIMSLLKPTVALIDERIKSARSSQVLLRSQIDSLVEDLRGIADLYQAPYDLDSYVKKLQECKKRVAVVSSILQNTQDRLTKLQANIAKETAKRKTLIEPPLPAPPN